MPLPKNMEKCMSKVKDEFPEGRSDKKKSKKAAHKQHVAMCLNAKENQEMNFTLKDYLLIESDEENAMKIQNATKILQDSGRDVTYENVAAVLGIENPDIVKRVVQVLSVANPDLIRPFHQR